MNERQLFGEEVKDVATRPDTLPMASGDFIGMVLSQPDSAEKVQLLRELIAMQNAERERVCKEDFDRHFAELRRALPAVVKNKVNKGTNSAYASLEFMQSKCDPIIFAHGFSYTWDEAEGDDGRKAIIMYLYGYGHTRQVRWSAPAVEGNRATNALQSAGVQSTYGQRYTYKSGFGIVIEGEDTDGQTVELTAELKAVLDAISNAATLNELMDAYQPAYRKYEKDINQQRLVVGEYNLAKARLAKAKP